MEFNPAKDHSIDSDLISWLGKLPTNWPLTKLKFCTRLELSNIDKLTADGEQRVQLCNYTDVYKNEFITEDMEFMAATASRDQISRLKLRKGDLVITKDSESPNDIGVPALVADEINDLVCGYHLAILRPTNIYSRYLRYFLLSQFARSSFCVKAKGLTRYAIGKEDIKGQIIPMPPLSIQLLLADRLEIETAKIDLLIEKQQRLIELLEEKRQAVISHAVTKGIDPTVPMKDSGVEWLGKVPAHWRIAKLKHVTSQKCDGPFGSGLKSEHYTENGVRVIRLQNIKKGYFDNSDAAFIDAEYHAQILGHDVEEGDLLIAGLGDDRNPVGRTCVAPKEIEPAMVKADCFRFRLFTGKTDTEFISFQLNTSCLDDAGKMSTGTTRSRIPLSVMATRVVALPGRDEQAAISNYINRHMEDFQKIIEKSKISIELLKERRSALISAAVTGKIDVREVA